MLPTFFFKNFLTVTVTFFYSTFQSNTDATFLGFAETCYAFVSFFFFEVFASLNESKSIIKLEGIANANKS